MHVYTQVEYEARAIPDVASAEAEIISDVKLEADFETVSTVLDGTFTETSGLSDPGFCEQCQRAGYDSRLYRYRGQQGKAVPRRLETTSRSTNVELVQLL